ncbi:NAD(P)-dependent oxidoreductase [Spirulina sp. 06S082]|uniref:NAD-dependent epimerase/dehydratase family protein n=1 Tax=Spirulina sp. 06S082 TaxID=3110248 RepID=UPI002B1EF34F|nr:NAD(P)-dependent oxidoreductase [Spirulina sp. 06S082]MEA5468202.1 NAD(P)-dependent oxidoreductase [Spirulina sp. 06S082]
MKKENSKALKNILVTGATGFLGHHVISKLVAEGYKVGILKRKFSDLSRLNPFLGLIDIFDLDTMLIPEILTSFQGDAIIHLATNYGRSLNEPITGVIESNLVFPLSLLECSGEFKIKVFINTDTYFNKFSIPYGKLPAYSLSKQNLLEWMTILRQKSSIKLFNLRLEHIFGPQDNSNKFLPFLIENLKNNVPKIDLTLGTQRRDFIYVEDVVDAFLTLIKKYHLIPSVDNSYIEYEVGTGESILLRDFVEMIHDSLNSRTKLNFGAIPYANYEIMDSKASINPLKNLGWHPQHTLSEGIEKTLYSNP